MSNEDTDLKLFRSTGEEIPFPEGSAMFIHASLDPISASAKLARTANGVLVDLSDPAYRKYSLSLSADDVRLPALANLWRGERFTVECPICLRERGTTPSRPVVPGTVALGDGWVEYRPILDALLTDNSLSETEGQGAASWSLSFEEV